MVEIGAVCVACSARLARRLLHDAQVAHNVGRLDLDLNEVVKVRQYDRVLIVVVDLERQVLGAFVLLNDINDHIN